MLRLIAVLFLLAVPGAAAAKECGGGNAVQRWYTVTDGAGRSFRVPLNPCDKDGNPTKDVDIKVGFTKEQHPPLPKCLRYAEKPGVLYVREPGEKEFKKQEVRPCLEHAKP